jgi:hypothetical protein
MSARILILFAHPSQHRSAVDRPLTEASRQAEAVTAGGAEDAYRARDYYPCTIREPLRPIEQAATLRGINNRPPCALFGVRTAVGEHTDNRKRILDCLYRRRIGPAIAYADDQLNDCLGRIAGDSR